VHRRDLFTSNDGVCNPLKTLLALNHLDDELSLDRFMILEDVRLELLITSTDLGDNIISLLFKMDLANTNEVK